MTVTVGFDHYWFLETRNVLSTFDQGCLTPTGFLGNLFFLLHPLTFPLDQFTFLISERSEISALH